MKEKDILTEEEGGEAGKANQESPARPLPTFGGPPQLSAVAIFGNEKG